MQIESYKLIFTNQLPLKQVRDEEIWDICISINIFSNSISPEIISYIWWRSTTVLFNVRENIKCERVLGLFRWTCDSSTEKRKQDKHTNRHLQIDFVRGWQLVINKILQKNFDMSKALLINRNSLILPTIIEWLLFINVNRHQYNPLTMVIFVNKCQ